MNGDTVTDHSEQGDASSLQKSSSQSADGSPTSNSSREAALSQQQAALNSIFKKKNNGVQYGSMPLSGSGTSAAPLQNSTGSAKGQKASKAGSSGGFSRIASPQKGAVPKVGKKEAQAPEDKTRPAAAGNARPIILFDRVSKLYPAQPNKPALNNISMTIYSGEFVFLVGHSGSGKSTFIRLINHEFTTSSGRLYVAGEDLSSIRRWRVPYLRRNIGCVFQDFKLLPNKTAFQNVAFALQVIGKSKHIIRTQVPEVLRLVGLEDKTNKYPDQLSGGEQQRVSIARAIVNRPPMLICDEPTGNLDPQTSLGIMRLLDRINRTGTTILVATHDREMVDSMRKRVVALENGFLVRDEDKGVYGLDA